MFLSHGAASHAAIAIDQFIGVFKVFTYILIGIVAILMAWFVIQIFREDAKDKQTKK